MGQVLRKISKIREQYIEYLRSLNVLSIDFIDTHKLP